MSKPAAFVLFLLAALIAGLATPVRAQTPAPGGALVSLYSLQTDVFPGVTAGLDVFDSAGNFVTGLTPAAVTILEDQQPAAVKTLQELPLGVQFALAFDPSPAFAIRDLRGVKRYDRIYQVLKDWADTHADSTGDDLSLIPTAGTASPHLASSAAFSQALTDYSPALALITPSLNTLSQALDAVTGQAPQVGMKRLVLFVTTPPGATAVTTLEGLAQRAQAEQVRVVVWIVGSKDTFTSAGTQALENLATQTGGQYILFTGLEPLPGLETYLAPLRHTYRLSFVSPSLASGTHRVVAQVNLNGQPVSSADLSFDIDVQPPNPMLVSPPDQIVRQAPDTHTTQTADFVPTSQEIDVLVEFPDGRTRPLVRTALYVDNQKVAENTAAPFDKFTWDLSGYTASGQHILQVEAVDDLGLSKTSVGLPIDVTIVVPPHGLLPFLAHNSGWLTSAAILAAGLVLGLILATGRLRRSRVRPARRGAHLDPVTAPVQSELVKPRARLPWSRPAKPAEAYLVRLKENGEPVTAAPIPVIVPEMTFGSDPIQANRILDDPSVSGLHARLRCENGEYLLNDEKSVAGTWVNYEPVNAPRRLKQGDVLQIGRITYRFTLHKQVEQPTPKVTRVKR